MHGLPKDRTIIFIPFTVLKNNVGISWKQARNLLLFITLGYIRLETVVHRCSSKKVFLKFCKFHKKTPVLQLLFNKVARFKACNFIKKRLQHRCFKIFREELPITCKAKDQIKAQDQITWSHIGSLLYTEDYHIKCPALFNLIIKDFKNRWKHWVQGPLHTTIFSKHTEILQLKKIFRIFLDYFWNTLEINVFNTKIKLYVKDAIIFKNWRT